MDVLSSRILLRPADLDRSQHFYRDVLGLAVYREFGSPAERGMVFFLGSGFLEVSGHAVGSAGASVLIWLQVRDVRAEYERLTAADRRAAAEQLQARRIEVRHTVRKAGLDVAVVDEAIAAARAAQ